jgi:hypothetical protein
VFGCPGAVKPLSGFTAFPQQQTHGVNGYYGLHGAMIFSVSSVFWSVSSVCWAFRSWMQWVNRAVEETRLRQNLVRAVLRVSPRSSRTAAITVLTAIIQEPAPSSACLPVL